MSFWFDKYNIDVGQSMVEKVQEEVGASFAVLFWVTENFLASKWCRIEMQSFIRRLMEEDIRVITILDQGIPVGCLPVFLQGLKCVMREENKNFEETAKEIAPAYRLQR